MTFNLSQISAKKRWSLVAGIIFVIWAMVAVVGATTSNRVFRLPVLEECKEYLLEVLENDSGIAWKYVPFDVTLYSHEEIVGIIEISGSKFGKNDLEELQNLLVGVCAPDTYISFDRNVDGYLNDFSKYIMYDKLLGVGRRYIKMTDSLIEFYRLGKSETEGALNK